MKIPPEVKWEDEYLTRPWVTETLAGPRAYVSNNSEDAASIRVVFNFIFLERGTSTYTSRNSQMKEADIYSSSFAGVTGDVGKSKQRREKLRMWWNFEKCEWTVREDERNWNRSASLTS